jgi:hypothetical protein
LDPNRTQLPEATIQLQQQLERWRARQPGGRRLPESFWQSAAELAKQHGLNPTARALRLDYTALKRRVVASSQPGKPEKAAFIELVTPGAKLEEYVIEFESPQGAKMRIQQKVAAPPDWASLLRAWRDSQR